MGIVRKHPLLTLIFVLASAPVVFLLVLEAAQHTPACTEWKAEVAARVPFRMKLSAFDEYHRGDMPVEDYYGRPRDQAAYELRESRPLLCE